MKNSFVKYFGYKSIYLIRNPYSGDIKIGVSENVHKRLRGIISQSGFEIELLYVSPPVSNSRYIETLIHRENLTNRTIGEWFSDVNIDDVIKSINVKIQRSKVCSLWKRFIYVEDIKSISKKVSIDENKLERHLKQKGFYSIKWSDYEHKLFKVSKILVLEKAKKKSTTT